MNTWQKHLKIISTLPPTLAYNSVQKKYPGNYTLQQRYDRDKGGYYYTMEWENLAERTMWLLRYS